MFSDLDLLEMLQVGGSRTNLGPTKLEIPSNPYFNHDRLDDSELEVMFRNHQMEQYCNMIYKGMSMYNTHTHIYIYISINMIFVSWNQQPPSPRLSLGKAQSQAAQGCRRQRGALDPWLGRAAPRPQTLEIVTMVKMSMVRYT